MGATSAHFKSSGKEPISRQLLKFFEMTLAENVPNSLITLDRSLLIPYSSSDAHMLLFNTNFSVYKLIIDWKFYKKE